MPLIALVGRAGSGKDTVADFLVKERDYKKLALADPMKHFSKELMGFTDEQLWGPSENRNAVDPRWGVSPRHVLQTLGTEWGRDTIHQDIWIRYMVTAAQRHIDAGSPGVVTSDCRFRNEADAIKAAGGKLIRIVRAEAGLGGAAGKHRSETEQNDIPLEFFDFVIDNNSDLRTLLLRTLQTHDRITGRVMPFNEARESVPPMHRADQGAE